MTHDPEYIHDNPLPSWATAHIARLTSQSLAEVVSDAIKSAGASQRQVAEATGIPLVTLNRRLSGRAPFHVSELAGIAQFLNTSLVDLFLRAELRVRDVH